MCSAYPDLQFSRIKNASQAEGIPSAVGKRRSHKPRGLQSPRQPCYLQDPSVKVPPYPVGKWEYWAEERSREGLTLHPGRVGLPSPRPFQFIF